VFGWGFCRLMLLKVRTLAHTILPASHIWCIVRLANLMKVLTTDAVQDPTKVEARVRREVAGRKINHDKMNNERKLTDDQRREKVENKKAEEERKGLFVAVFKCVYSFNPFINI
jgi:beta-lactamase regulating signal transducer with metallopeptidase domain